MNTSRPATPRWRARTTASATRHLVSASAPCRSKAFSQSCFASVGKIATDRGPGVSGALYIGESISSSKIGAADRPQGNSKTTSEPISLVRIVAVLLGSGELPRLHGQDSEQDDAGR